MGLLWLVCHYCADCFIQITVQKPVKEGQEERVDLDLEQTNCEVCGGSDREDRLLLCDGCDAGSVSCSYINHLFLAVSRSLIAVMLGFLLETGLTV